MSSANNSPKADAVMGANGEALDKGGAAAGAAPDN